MSDSTRDRRPSRRRVAETFQKEVAKGKQTVEFTELEKLLAKYVKAEAEYLQRRAISQYTQAEAEYMQRKAKVDVQVAKDWSSRVSVDSGHSSVDTASEEEPTIDTTTVQPVATAAPVQPSIPSATVQSTAVTAKSQGENALYSKNGTTCYY
ncbi:hypothetical protein PI124_g5255 [Phytophthora idaei]|nr:hypothetical protein PI125_g21684 [Phytophthora idaei]KAG3131411.1 hypothetical protein PI126_g20067 [Phytophthora idaei]KAG3250135.1 hypothetical protein PI124_g5255 [Phytophthora idaei]